MPALYLFGFLTILCTVIAGIGMFKGIPNWGAFLFGAFVFALAFGKYFGRM